MEPHNFLQLIEKNHAALNEVYRDKLISRISAEEKTTENWLYFMMEGFFARTLCVAPLLAAGGSWSYESGSQ